MRRLSVSGFAILPSFPARLLQSLLRIGVVVFVGLAAAVPGSLGQIDAAARPPVVDILGAHGAGGRGCASCHIPHNDVSALGSGVNGESAEPALWGPSANPPVGKTFALTYDGNFVEVQSVVVATGTVDVSGILLCLSCHDGNLTPQNMMARRSYAGKMGLLGRRGLGDGSVPTLLGDDGEPTGVSRIDHPIGGDAPIATGYGLMFSNGVFSVTPGSPYARFVANYGWPALAPLKRSNAYGLDATGKPYVLCTTCHNQHLMTAYASTATSPISGDGGGHVYSTYFFANGPYNPNYDTAPATRAPSTAQFCRQCHFNDANEGNNTYTLPTLLSRD